MPKILYVEDDDAARRSFTDLLKFDYDVSPHRNVQSALKALANQGPFDLIITDYDLSKGGGDEQDGVAFARAVRTSGNTIPIILLSGTGEDTIRADQPDFGDLGIKYAMKTTRIDELIKSQLARRTIGDISPAD